MNKSGAGYLLVETLRDNISEAYQNCCHGNSEKTCRMFYDVNPSNDCSGYITPQYSKHWSHPRVNVKKTLGNNG